MVHMDHRGSKGVEARPDSKLQAPWNLAPCNTGNFPK